MTSISHASDRGGTDLFAGRDESSVSPTASVAYPQDTSDKLRALERQFKRRKRAPAVSFRNLVPWVKPDRATHYLHPYPAKLLPQIAHFFIAAQAISKPGDVILDPFGGTGTVALEATLAGRRAYFADANPLARLIAAAKTTPIDPVILARTRDMLLDGLKRPFNAACEQPSVVNLKYWFKPRVIASLLQLRQQILDRTAGAEQRFFLVVFSSVCQKASCTDPRLSVPVFKKKRRALRHSDIVEMFRLQSTVSIERMKSFSDLAPNGSAICVGEDARNIKEPGCSTTALHDRSVHMIITSPPYVGAQKYIRASSLSLGWLGLATAKGLKTLENKNIGREHLPISISQDLPSTGLTDADRRIRDVAAVNSRRAAIAAVYLIEMSEALREMHRVLVPGGHLVLVVGNNTVCGRTFQTSRYLAAMCTGLGLELRLEVLDAIRSRGLMTRRNKTAGVISRERVMLWRKPA